MKKMLFLSYCVLLISCNKYVVTDNVQTIYLPNGLSGFVRVQCFGDSINVYESPNNRLFKICEYNVSCTIQKIKKYSSFNVIYVTYNENLVNTGELNNLYYRIIVNKDKQFSNCQLEMLSVGKTYKLHFWHTSAFSGHISNYAIFRNHSFKLFEKNCVSVLCTSDNVVDIYVIDTECYQKQGKFEFIIKDTLLLNFNPLL